MVDGCRLESLEERSGLWTRNSDSGIAGHQRLDSGYFGGSDRVSPRYQRLDSMGLDG